MGVLLYLFIVTIVLPCVFGQQECFGAGSVAGAAIGGFLAAILFVVAAYYLRQLYLRRKNGFFPAVLSDQSSSEPSPAPLDEEIFRDAPLYPPLREPFRFTDLHNQETTEIDHNEYGTEDKIYNYNTDSNREPEVEIRNVKDLEERLDNQIEPQDVFEMFDDKDFFTPENIYDSRNPFKSSTDILNEPKEGGVIVAPGANSDEINRLLEEEARVDNVDVKFGGDKNKSDEDARTKRSSGWEKPAKSRRVKTGDTILNIRGAVRDAIGDAGAAPGPRASSRVDAFVIRPSPVMRDEPRDQAREAEARREKIQTPQPQNQDRELLVEAHSHARLDCDLVNVTDVQWFKDNEQVNLPLHADGVDGADGADGAALRAGDAVVVPRATRSHAARWRCAGRDRAGRLVAGRALRLLIYEPVRSLYLAVDGRRLDAGNTWVPVRDRSALEVRCVAEGGVPPPELSWRLLAVEPALDHRPYLRVHPTNYSMDGTYWSRAVVTAARELHNATLQCAARQRRPAAPPPPPATPHAAPPAPPAAPHAPPAEPRDALAAKLEIHVTYPPSFVISRWPGFGVALRAGAPAALRCDVDANPPARPLWTRDGAAALPRSSPTPLEAGGAGGEGGAGAATLRWARLGAAHAGWYQCRATWLDTEYSSIGYYLNVLAPDESVQSSTEANEEPVHQKVEVPVGGDVQLHCPKGSVGCWWRRVVGAANGSEGWAPAGSHHAHGVLGISEAMWEEGGEYRCVGTRSSERARLKELKRVTLSVTGGATARALSAERAARGWRLTCAVCGGRGLRAAWLAPGAGLATPAALAPGAAPHCWRAALLAPDDDERWCVATSAAGGAVAVFPKRSPAPSISPARHAVRALHSGSLAPGRTPLLLFMTLVLLPFIPF